MSVDPRELEMLTLLMGGGAPSSETTVEDYSAAGLTPESMQAAYGDVGLSPQQKMSSTLVQLVPLAIAALAGGGAEKFQAGADAGISAGKTAMTDFGEEAKRRQQLNLLGVKSAFGVANQRAKDRAREKLQTKLLDKRVGSQEKLQEDRQAHDLTKIDVAEKARERLKSFEADLKAKNPESKAEDWEVNDLNRIGREIWGNEYSDAPLGMDRKQLIAATQRVKEGRVTNNMRERFEEDRAKTAPGIAFKLSNPNNDRGGSRFDAKEKAQIEAGTQAAMGTMNTIAKLGTLYDPRRKVPADQNEINQELNALINQIKEMQNMGANFTITEQGIVRSQIGAADFEPTLEAADRYFRKKVLMGADFSKNLDNLRVQMADRYLEALSSKETGLKVDDLGRDPTGAAFLRELQRAPRGAAAINSWRERAGAKQAPSAGQKIIQAGGASYQIITMPDGSLRKKRVQ